MSMDQSAVREIVQLALVPKVTDKLEYTDRPVAALPENFRLHDLEQFQDCRNSYRGAYRTSSMPAFASYASAYGQNEQLQCFVDQEDMSAKLFFDLGTEVQPGHGDHTATLHLKQSAAFIALNVINNQQVRQKQLAEWLEDWASCLTVSTEDGESLTLAQAVAAVRRITIEATSSQEHTQENMRSARSAMEQIEAKTREAMPAFFTMTCVPYQGLAEREFTLRMSVICSGEAPRLVLRVVRFDELIEEMAQEFADKIEADMPENVRTLLGTFQH